MSKHRKREQKPKGTGNRAMNDAFQEIRRSSAAQPHKNKARYDRNVKHKGKGWD